ncbi:glycosyltransferase family 4 protein [Paractinoplanes rishiriensis]|uniref:Glycosyl transferase n=1 Tax=Paractinoplanes rishiriensis TaxID=1050105 RepID=A0A919K664_9ACTN|nr:glycosyltransferase family 4 protein [Actinoplanes rishiriensis]GIE97346.1 glycosyl transferase [Actinoplanes rishiriensis]
MSSPLWAVLPGGIDDPAAPSGGNRYDRIVLSLLSGDRNPAARNRAADPAAQNRRAADPAQAAPPLTRDVHEIAIPGSWPSPAPAARATLARALGDVPDKSDVLLDGLVACGVPDVLQPHRRRLRLVILVHLPLSDETGLEPAEATRLREAEGAALRHATAVIATSAAAAARISDMHGISGVAVAIPGVDPAPPAVPDPRGHRLLCVASVTPRKGQDLLVAALERDLADLEWDCTFVGAVGKPVPFRHPAIRFVGPRTGQALGDAYGRSDLFVLPSRAETYGMVVTEALAHAVPVLATEVGGVPEALGHAPDGSRPGLLIPPGDPAALAAALRAWLTGPALRERLRTAALGRRETLPTWTDTARRVSEVLDR